MKYIDADKLKAEIERLYDIAREASYNGEIEGEMTAYDKILSFIDSLQQVQQEVDLNKEIQSFWNANALVYRLGHVADINFLAYTARHFYELGQQNRSKISNNSLKELRKEVIKFNQDHFDELHSDMDTIDIVHIVARHFYELGLNARKED